MRKQSQVRCNFVSGLSNPRKHVHDLNVNLSRVSLSGDLVGRFKPNLGGDELIEVLYFFMISVKKL